MLCKSTQTETVQLYSQYYWKLRRQYCHNFYIQILYTNVYKLTKYLKKEDSKTARLAAYYVASLLTVTPCPILFNKNL